PPFSLTLNSILLLLFVPTCFSSSAMRAIRSSFVGSSIFDTSIQRFETSFGNYGLDDSAMNDLTKTNDLAILASPEYPRHVEPREYFHPTSVCDPDFRSELDAEISRLETFLSLK